MVWIERLDVQVAQAIVWMSAFALGLSLIIGWKWNPGVGFGVIATAAVPLVILVYMLVSVGCLWHYWSARRSEFNPLLHLVVPITGMVLFFFPLYYQFYKTPPPYPFKNGNWYAIVWAIVGLALTFYVTRFARERLRDVDRVYVEDAQAAPAAAGD